MECRASSGDSRAVSISGSQIPSPFESCPKEKMVIVGVDPNSAKSEFEPIIVKKENIYEGGGTGRSASQTSLGTCNLPTAQRPINDSILPPKSPTDSATGPCQFSYDDPTSYHQVVPGLFRDLLKEEMLFTDKEEVEENGPLADLDDDTPLVSSGHEFFKTTIECKEEHSPDEQKTQDVQRLGSASFVYPGAKTQDVQRLGSASFVYPGAAKLPLCDPMEGIKSLVQKNPTNFVGEILLQEPSSVQSPSHTKQSESSLSAVSEKISLKSTDQRKRVPTTRSRASQATLNKPEKEFLDNLFAPSNEHSISSSLFHDKNTLDQHAKSIVYSVVSYFQKKKKQFSLNYNVATVASDATKLSKYQIQGIVSMGRRSLQDDPTLEFPTFGRNYTEKCKNCGDVLVDFAIREIIFNGYVEERKALTIKEISAYLDADELSVCHDFLRRRIRDVGFDLMRSIATTRYLPLERPELTASRYRYYQAIQTCRIMQRQIVYVFEADLSKVVHGKVTWEPLEGHPTKQDTHLMTVIHAARESGFIDGFLLVHMDSLRQHRRRKWPLTLFWLNSHLPRLPKGSVVVLGHNRHNFVRPAKPKPDPSWPKEDLVKWLHDHQQDSFSSDLPSAVLLEKVHTIDVGTKFGIDDLIISHGHIPVHLPPNHRELNPIELVWRKILEKFPAINISSIGHMTDFVRNEFDSFPLSELQEAFELAKKHENILRHLDMRIDEPVAEVIRRVGGILDRNYALKEDESSDDDQSNDVMDVLLETIVEKGSGTSKNKYKNDQASFYQLRKKIKIASQQSPWDRSQEISKQGTEGWDSSQLRTLEGHLTTSSGTVMVQSKENRAEAVDAANLIVVANEQGAPCSTSSSPSGNNSSRVCTYETDGCDNFQLNSFDGNLRISDETSLVQEKSRPDADDCTNGSESVCRSQSVADVRDITFESPLEEQDLRGIFWEPVLQNLTTWPKALTESVTTLIPPLPNPFVDQFIENSCIEVSCLEGSNEESPGLIQVTGNGENNVSRLDNVQMIATEIETPSSKSSPSPENPLDPELSRDPKSLIT